MAGKEKSLLDTRLKQNATERWVLTRGNQSLGNERENRIHDLMKALKALSKKWIIPIDQKKIDTTYVTQNRQTLQEMLDTYATTISALLDTWEKINYKIPHEKLNNEKEKERLLMEKSVLKSIPPERAEMLVRLREYYQKFLNEIQEPKYENDYRNIIQLLHEGKVIFNGMESTEFPELDIMLYRDMAPIGKKEYVKSNAKQLGKAWEIRDVYLNKQAPKFDNKEFVMSEAARNKWKSEVEQLVEDVKKEWKYIGDRETFDKVLNMLKGNKIVALHFLWQAQFNHAIISHGKEVNYSSFWHSEKNRYHDYIFGPRMDEDHYREHIMSYFQDGGYGSLPIASKISTQQKKAS